MTNIEIIIITIMMIILGVGLANRIENDLDKGNRAEEVRENCSETEMFTIDAHGRVHIIYDCGEDTNRIVYVGGE